MTSTTNKKQEIAISEKSIELTSPKDLVNFAETLKTVIVQQKLYTPIKQGDGKIKNHVHVEGWQFAGFNMGIVPVVTEVCEIKTDRTFDFSKWWCGKGVWHKYDNQHNDKCQETKTEGIRVVKYEACVDLIRVSDGSKVGHGRAICTNEERGRELQDEYIIESMAQTRAVGKAFRTVIGWLMKMAGYEATPAEEMYDIDGDDIVGDADEKKVREDIKKQRAAQSNSKAQPVK